MRVHLGTDHAGLELKDHLIVWLQSLGHEPVDHGAFEYDALDDYPVFCLRAALGVADEPGSLGIVIGGSGNGEQMAANKVRGVRAALAYDEELARLAREHNDARILSIGARMSEPEVARAMVRTFVATPFSGEERHVRRLRMIEAYEADGTLPPVG